MKQILLMAVLASSLVMRVCAEPAFRFFEPLTPPRSTQIMAHRGMAGQAPESTRPAIQRAIEDGIEWIEVDVRLTKDGQHAVFHDETLEGKTNGSGSVKDCALADFLKLDAGSKFGPRYAGVPPLSLSQCLEFAKGRVNVCLDCKDVNPEQLAAEITGAGMEKQVIVFDKPDVLRRVNQASGGKVPIMAHWRVAEGTAKWIDELKPAGVEISVDEITPERCAEFHAKGIRVEAILNGAADRAETWTRMKEAGVDWLQTDKAEEIVALLTWKSMPKRPVMMSLHRGANRYAPENTFPAFDKAIALGTDYVEFDVRTTPDGKFFLLHDGALDRTTNGKGLIRSAPAEAVRVLDAGAWFGKPFAGQPLPTLEAFLDKIGPQTHLYFDAKDIPPEALAAALQSRGLVERTAVYQGYQYLKKLKEINPKIGRMPPLGDRKQIEKIATEVEPYAFDVAWEILSKELIEECHARGIKVFSDALGKHEKIEHYLQAMDWGIDLIQTDHPLRLMRAVELWQRGSRPTKSG